MILTYFSRFRIPLVQVERAQPIIFIIAFIIFYNTKDANMDNNMTDKPSVKRKKQYKRSKDIPNLTIQSRDLDIFQDLLRMRVLTQSQIQRLYFPSKNRAQVRLRTLFDNSFLARAYYPYRIEGGGKAPNLYVLDQRGADALRGERPEFKFKWHYSYKKFSDDFLRHTIPLNEFLVLMRIAAPKNGFYEITDWRTETELRKNFDYVYLALPNGHRKRIAVIPDAFFIIEDEHYRYPFFVEWDGTTQTEKVIKQKVQKYVTYYESGQYKERYQFKLFRVLFVCQTTARMKTLKQWVEDTNLDGIGAFFFASLDALTTENVFKKPVWLRGGHRERVALLPNL